MSYIFLRLIFGEDEYRIWSRRANASSQERQRHAIFATGDRVRDLASDSHPSGNPPRRTDGRVLSISRDRLLTFLSSTGRRSPFRVWSTVVTEAAAPKRAVATDASILSTPKEIARSTAQPPTKYRAPQRIDNCGRVAHDVFSHMTELPK